MPLPKGYKYDYKKSVEARKIENAVPKEVFAKVRKLWLQGLGYEKVAEQVNLNSNQIETIIGRLKTKNIKGVKRITQKDIQSIESEIRYMKDGKAYKIIKGKTVFQPDPALETAANEAVELFKDYEKIKIYPSSIWKDLVKKHKVNRSSLHKLFYEKTNNKYDLQKDFRSTLDKRFVEAAVDYSKLTDKQKKKFGTKAKILTKVLGKEPTRSDHNKLWKLTADAGISVKEELPPSKYKQDRPRIIKKQSSRLIEGTLGTGKGMSKKVIDVSAKKGSLLDLMHLSGKTSPIKVGELGFGPRAINQLLGGRLAGPKETRGKGNLPEPERYRNQLERHMEKIAKNYKNKAYYRIQTTPDSIDQRLFKNVLQRLFGKTAGKIPLKEYLDKVVNEEARLFGQTTEGLIPVQLLDPDTLTKTLPIGRDPTTTIGYGTEIETEPLKGLEKEYKKMGWREIAAEKASGEMGPTTQKFATLEAEAQNKFLYTLLNSQKKIHTDQNKIKAVARNIEEMAKQGFINAADEDFNNIRNLAAQCSKLRLASAGGGRIGMAQGDPCSRVVKAIKELPPEKYAVAAEKLPEMSFVQKIFSKIPKGGRLGMAAATLGAVGAGTWAMMGGAKGEETPTTEQMTYNATTGEFDNAEGDPETQEGILNWIADHPIYSGLAPIPIGIGAGLGAEAMNAPKVGEFFKSMKFILPPAYAAEKLHQYKRGDDMGQMFANPIDAVWAMALDTKDSRNIKWEHYKNLAKTRPGWGAAAATKAGEKAAIEAEQLGLHPRTWKNIGRAITAPASRGTRLVMPLGTKGYGFGDPITKGWRALAPKGIARGLGMIGRVLPVGPIPMALLATSMAWDKYKFNKEVGNHVDALRARGVVSEEDAQSMNTIYKQGWLGTTAIGAKILGSEELMLDGELADIEKQKEVLAKMKSFYEDEEKKGKKYRAGERQEDFFDWFSKGGRVGLAEGGNKPPFSMTRRSFLKWLVGSIVAGVAAVSGKGLKQAAKTATATVAKTPQKFIGVEGMPAWFPRAVEKIKTHGKLIELADKDYVGGDMYEMMIPVKIKRSLSGRKGHDEIVTEQRKVTMSDNPLTGEINMHWTGTDNFGDDAIREINFKPGQAGYQKFGVDPEYPQAWEYQRVKVDDPEFSYTQPDQSNPYRDDIEYLDIFEEGDEIVKGLEDMTGGKNMVAKDGTVIDVSAEGKGVDEAFKKKIYKDIEGEDALVPDPEGSIGPEGDWLGDSPNEMIGGDVPDWVPKDKLIDPTKKASGGRVGMKFGGSWADWMSNHSDQMTFEEYLKMDIDKPVHPIDKKAGGGVIETGNIARRPGAVPPLSGPTPQGTGIVGLFSSPKRVNIA